MTKYIIVCPKNGKAVQNWSFADRKHIVYCNSPEWAMKWDNEKSANERNNLQVRITTKKKIQKIRFQWAVFFLYYN